MLTRLKRGAARLWAKVKYYFLATLAAVGLVSMAPAAPKNFTWDNPVAREDGSAYDALTEQAEVRLYCDGDTVPTIVVPGAATAAVGDFSFGSHSCFATVVDNFGQESGPSNTVSFVVTPARPNPPVLSVN